MTSAPDPVEELSAGRPVADPSAPAPRAWSLPAPRVATPILVLWGLSMAWALVRLARAARRARHLLAGAGAVDPHGELGRRFAAARARAAIRDGRLLVTGTATAPAACGIARPTVVLPASLAAEATPAELDAIFAHELAHLARRDPLRHLALQLLLVPVAFHPAVAPLRRALTASREAACDERAALALGRREYGRALLGATALLAGFPRPALPLGVADGDDLEVRMQRLQPGFRLRSRALTVAALLAATLVLTLAGAGAVAFAGSVEPAPGAGFTPDRLAGVWLGTYEGGDDNGQPGAALTISLVDGAPRAALLSYRYQKQADGSLAGRAIALPVLAESLEGTSLRLTTRDDRFRFRGAPATSVDFEWRFTWLAPGSGRLEVVSNSYFLAARQRGEKVPPPPPPMEMKLQE